MEITLISTPDGLAPCADLMVASEPWTTLRFDWERCLTSIQGDYKEVYVAQVDGQFAGFVVLQLYGVLRGYIQTICVAPAFRNKGIGTALLRFSEERIWKMSPNVFMCVSSFNSDAQRLYARLGFEKVGEFKDHLVKGYDEYLLRKSKGPFAEFTPTN